jgi:tetratricopeptide (TPR) repeat protein
MRMKVLEAASQSNVLPAMKAIAERSMALAEETIDRHNFDAARRLLASAETAARKANSPPLLARVQARNRELTEISREYEPARAALEVLLQKPNDAEANYKLGRFLCFFKGNWEEGLPCLVKGSDAKLRFLAGREVTKPTSSIAQRELGDDWWDLAEKNTGLARKHLLLHVKYWYEQCISQLPVGLERTRVERRLREIPTLVGADGPEKTPDKTTPPPLPLNSYERQLAIGQNSLKLGIYQKAIDAFAEALKAKPGDLEATKGLNDARYANHMVNGQNALARKDYNRAVDEFNSALKYRQGDLAATTALQQAKSKLGSK